MSTTLPSYLSSQKSFVSLSLKQRLWSLIFMTYFSLFKEYGCNVKIQYWLNEVLMIGYNYHIKPGLLVIIKRKLYGVGVWLFNAKECTISILLSGSTKKMCVILNIFLNRNKQSGNYKLWCTFKSSNFLYFEITGNNQVYKKRWYLAIKANI